MWDRTSFLSPGEGKGTQGSCGPGLWVAFPDGLPCRGGSMSREEAPAAVGAWGSPLPPGAARGPRSLCLATTGAA